VRVDGDAIVRKRIIRGLRGTDDIITVEIYFSEARIVTMAVEVGAVDARGQLLTESDTEAAFTQLQHCPMSERPVATVFAPVDAASLRRLLDALWRGGQMQLTLVVGE